MKRALAGISLLAVLLLGSLGVSRQMQRMHEPIAASLRQAATADTLAAEDAVQKARQVWQRYRKFTAAFADHTPMEEIDVLFARLEVHPPASEEFRAICQEIVRRLTDMAQSHQPTWWNLL